jgi:hypothetical protein
MMILPLVLAATLSPHVGEILEDAGRAYVGGARPPEVVAQQPSPKTGAAAAILRFSDGVEIPRDPTDLVIGDTPAETLVILGTWVQTEDVVIINDGVLIIRDADFTMDGNIIVTGEGVLQIEGSALTFDQKYIYQYGVFALESGSVSIRNSNVAAEGYPYNFAAMDSASVVIDSVHYEDFTTYALFGGPSLDKRHVNLAGEFVVMDSAHCTFVDIDTILIWHAMMDSSVIDFTFPPFEEPLYDWFFNDTVPGVDGIAYTVYCDSVYCPWWGMFSGSGSDVTIRDSEVRTCGIFFEGASVDTMDGFVNGMTYDDLSFPFSDRTLRFVNTKVRTISLYPWDLSQLHFSGSIVGEVLSMDTSFVFGQSYYLDGSGGHIEANGYSGHVAALAMITADALVREHGFLVIVASAQLFGHNWADGSSRLFMVQTSTAAEPVAYDSASVGYEFVSGPADAPINSLVPIMGSVWVDGGPHSTADLLGYRFFYERAGQEERHPIGAEQTEEVRDDTLIVWDTTGLSTGNYALVLQFYDTMGDTLDGYSLIRLEALGADDGPVPATIRLVGCQAGTELRFSFRLPTPGETMLSLYDVTGRRVAVPFSGLVGTDERTVRYRPASPGLYVARLDTPAGSLCRRVTFAR